LCKIVILDIFVKMVIILIILIIIKI
jgi:hypothetical protein